MPRLLIECPDTHKMIYTGLNFNWETLESASLDDETLPCTECGKVHHWTSKDVILDETGSSS